METIVRNTAIGFTARANKSYEALNKEDDHGCQSAYSVFTYPYQYNMDYQWEFSGPRILGSKGHHHYGIYGQVVYNNNNNKIERARQRQIFLQTYKLSSIDNDARKSKARKVKRVVNKVKSSFLSALSFHAMASSCKCETSISVYSPRLSVNCC